MVLKAIFVDERTVGTAPMRSEFLQQFAVGILAAIILILGVVPAALVSRIATALP
jgi:hypothetical protein